MQAVRPCVRSSISRIGAADPLQSFYLQDKLTFVIATSPGK
jgi:hypothetical protein